MNFRQLFPIAFKAALAYKLGGMDWCDHELKLMQGNGRLKTMSLGAIVEVPVAGGARLTYPATQISVPITWTSRDEFEANTENKQVSMAKGLAENLINSHDFILLERLGTTGKAVASKTYKYDLGVIQELATQDGPLPEDTVTQYGCKLYTILAFID